MIRDTIAAVATPPGQGGIGIVKISGKRSLDILKRLFRPGNKKTSFESHRLIHGRIVTEDGRVIDEVLATVMRSPHSYTGEDVVEIQAHGGYAVISNILECALKQGARLAEPGEFTRRAFLNGRIDLTQAEAIFDVIHAKSDVGLTVAARGLDGDMGKRGDRLRQKIIGIMSLIEAAIDFPDDTEISYREIRDQIQLDIQPEITEMITNYRDGRLLREGVRIGIVGRPNVGKSSLMNALLERQRMIVTPHPGTTRDSVEEWLQIEGLDIAVTDTAGLRDSPDPIEAMGIQQTFRIIEESDLILFVFDLFEGISEVEIDTVEMIQGKPVICIFNKKDLQADGAGHQPPERLKEYPSIKVSALLGDGVRSVKKAITDLHKNAFEDVSGNRAIPNLRQRILLEEAKKALDRSVEGMDTDRTPELISIDLKEAADSIGEISGRIGSDEVLDSIFKNFCIGK